MAIGPARMSFMDHLGELRRRLIIVFGSLVAAACVLYLVTPQIMSFLIEPIRPFLPDGVVILDPLGGFMIRFKVSFYAALITCAPLVLWEFLAFFLPALTKKERRWFVPSFFVGVALFCVGLVFCYRIILPPAFGWMLSQTSDVATVLPDAYAYYRLILGLEVGFGVAFELPLVMFYLIVTGIVPYANLRKHWRGIYIGLMVFSAMVTPDASPVTMLLMFAALVGLYEVALLVARTVLARRIRAQADEEGGDEDDGDDARRLPES